MNLPPVFGIDPDAHQLMATYGWPGNVRELENVIERTITLGQTEYIRPEDLRKNIRGLETGSHSNETYKAESAVFQKALYEKMLRKTKGNKREAARRLKLNPDYFSRRCRELNVQAL